MSSLLSAISGKFSTSVILGTFFPVTVFVFLARVLWVPLLPPDFHPALLAPLAGLDDKWELFLLTLVTIVLTGLLYNLNTPLLGLYEGYPWRESAVGRWKTKRHLAGLRTLRAQQEGLFPLRREFLREGKLLPDTDPRKSALRAWIKGAREDETAARRILFAHFPKEKSVMPTRFGNAVRCFENYPENQYGMFSTTLWPRLIAVIEPAYAEAIEGAKASVDFMVVSSLLSGLLALVLLATGLIYPASFGSVPTLVLWLTKVALFVALSWWLYSQAISHAIDWGHMVRGAFDLYRGKLLEKLGYGYAPATVEEEKALWRAISDRIESGDPPEGAWPLPVYARQPSPATPPTYASNGALVVTRGVLPLPEGGLRVVLRVQNRSVAAKAEPVDRPSVTDFVPEGFHYRWGSVSLTEGAGEVEVQGTNPYQFQLTGSLDAGASLQIEYSLVPRASRGLVRRRR